MAVHSFFAIPFLLCLYVSLDHALQCRELISLTFAFSYSDSFGRKGADFCFPMVILGKRLQTAVASLHLQWEVPQIPWRCYKNAEGRWCYIHSLSQKISSHDQLRMSLQVFGRHTVMICLKHYHGNTNSFISIMCMVPIGPCCNRCSVLSLNWIFENPQCMNYCCITCKVSKELTHCEVLPDLFISLTPVSLLGKLRQWSCKCESWIRTYIRSI